MKALLPTTIKGIATALLAEHPQLRERIVKAVELLLAGGLVYYAHTEEGEAVYTALSQSSGNVYTVMSGQCTCPSRKLCYHRVARGILVARSANRTAVAFDEALSLEDQEPTDTGAGTTPTTTAAEAAPPAAYHGPAYTGDKRVQSSGRMSKGLTIRASMDALGRRLVEVLTQRPEIAKLQ